MSTARDEKLSDERERAFEALRLENEKLRSTLASVMRQVEAAIPPPDKDASAAKDPKAAETKGRSGVPPEAEAPAEAAPEQTGEASAALPEDTTALQMAKLQEQIRWADEKQDYETCNRLTEKLRRLEGKQKEEADEDEKQALAVERAKQASESPRGAGARRAPAATEGGREEAGAGEAPAHSPAAAPPSPVDASTPGAASREKAAPRPVAAMGGVQRAATALRKVRQSGLTYLRLDQAGLGDAEVGHLITEIKSEASSRLKGLYLSDNNITDDGASALADALREKSGLTMLTKLFLGGNPISSKGSDALHTEVAKVNQDRFAMWRKLALPWAIKGGWCKGDRVDAEQARQEQIEFERCVARGTAGLKCSLERVTPALRRQWTDDAMEHAKKGGWQGGHPTQAMRGDFERAVAAGVRVGGLPGAAPERLVVVGVQPPPKPPPKMASPPRSRPRSPPSRSPRDTATVFAGATAKEAMPGRVRSANPERAARRVAPPRGSQWGISL